MSRKDVITLWGSLLVVALTSLIIDSAFAQLPMASFICERGGADEVCVVFQDGQVEPITKNGASTKSAEWSPDGNYIMFSANLAGGENFRFLLMDLIDPENPQQIDVSENQALVMLSPRWAPTGDRILIYSTGLPGVANNWAIGMFIIEEKRRQGIELGALIGITKPGGIPIGQDQEASWSPDGTKIVFESGRDLVDQKSQFDIFIADAEEDTIGQAEALNLSKHPATDQNARFSPDGTKVIFESKRDGNWELYVVDITGENLKRLTENEKTDRRAEWSQSGIFFETQRDGNWEIYRMDPDGNNPVNLTNDPGSDNTPVPSANGRKVLFTSRRDGNREIYVMDSADGGALQNLSNSPGDDIYPRWNPIFFMFPVEPQEKQLTTLGEVKRASLLQNYPNPFNPETWMPYHLAEDAFVTVKIYNIKGVLVRSLEIGKQPAGTYLTRGQAVYWDGRDDLDQPVASGVYFYQLSADNFSQTRRMVLMK